MVLCKQTAMRGNNNPVPDMNAPITMQRTVMIYDEVIADEISPFPAGRTTPLRIILSDPMETRLVINNCFRINKGALSVADFYRSII